jgi:hypothetical protein
MHIKTKIVISITLISFTILIIPWFAFTFLTNSGVDNSIWKVMSLLMYGRVLVLALSVYGLYEIIGWKVNQVVKVIFVCLLTAALIWAAITVFIIFGFSIITGPW